MGSAAKDEAQYPRLRSSSKVTSSTSSRDSEMTGWDPDQQVPSRASDHLPGDLPASQAPEMPRKPLIEYCTNEWQRNDRWKTEDATRSSRWADALDSVVDRCVAIVKAPKVRRAIIMYTLVFAISIWLWAWAIWRECLAAMFGRLLPT
jgi:hypothetical protein